MWLFQLFLFATLLALFVKYLLRLNKDYFILAMCKRIKTVDGSKLEDKVHIVRGKTVFGNNLDFNDFNSEKFYTLTRDWARESGGKSYLLHTIHSPIYNIISAADAEAVLQSQNLIAKNVIYELLKPFLGDGLLISKDKKWHSRRKMLTPTFHFNILQTFLEIFKEECQKCIDDLKNLPNGILTLDDVIPQFTLNNICETALGVRLDDTDDGKAYRKAIHIFEEILVERLCNPMYFYQLFFYCFGNYKKHKQSLAVIHEFSSKIISQRRREFQKQSLVSELGAYDEFGKKKRYAMLDTLLDAEANGLIDHEGICDEVNTFMFEGFDTTSTCLTFSLLNLAWHPKMQQKCYEEIASLGNLGEITVFDLNKLEYLECFIKETLRLYPSVPFMGRCVERETVVNGLIMPANTQIHIHVLDIMRDEAHFKNANVFDPDRFLPENNTNRHPFAFVPFSAGPRNCIGQKFAMLEVKMLLSGILQHYIVQPITKLEDIILENGIVLRTKHKTQVKLLKRK